MGARVVAGFALAACSPVPVGKAPTPLPVEAGPTQPRWEQWLPRSKVARSSSVISIEDPVTGVCQSHAGCEGAYQELPPCTSLGPLPSGYVHLRGHLETAEQGPHYSQGVLSCDRQNLAQEQLATEASRYDLGLGCTGDRTGWCCPYTPGTSVQIVAKLATNDAGHSSLADYWLCADPAQGAPPPSAAERASMPPALVDLGESPGTIVWTAQRGLALWHVSEAAPLLLPQQGAPFACLSVSPSGRAAFSIDGAGTGTLWALPAARPLVSVAGVAAPHHPGRIEPDLSCSYVLTRKLEWSADGERLLTVQLGSTARLWNTTRGTQTQLAPHAELTAHAQYFSPDGSALLLPTAAGQLELLQASDAKVLASTKGKGGIFALDQRRILVNDSDGAGSELRVWEPPQADTRVLLADACGASVSADGRVVAAASPCNSGHHVAVDIATGHRLLEREGQFRPFYSSRAYAAPRFDDELAFLIEKAEPPSRPRVAPRISPKSELLVFPRADGLELHAAGRAVAKLAVKVPAWTAGMTHHARLSFSPDGKKLTSGAWLWTDSSPTRTVALEAELPRAQLIFSPDSRFLATWAWALSSQTDSSRMKLSLRVFDAGTGRLLQRLDLEAPAAPRQAQLGLSSPAWLPQGPVLLLPVLGDAAAVDLLNVVSGKQLRVALGADGGVPGGGQAVREFLSNEKR